MTDLDYMKIAINNAKKAYDLDEVPIGCVIVRDNVIISSTYNRKEIDNIATYHAQSAAGSVNIAECPHCRLCIKSALSSCLRRGFFHLSCRE